MGNLKCYIWRFSWTNQVWKSCFLVLVWLWRSVWPADFISLCWSQVLSRSRVYQALVWSSHLPRSKDCHSLFGRAWKHIEGWGIWEELGRYWRSKSLCSNDWWCWGARENWKSPESWQYWDLWEGCEDSWDILVGGRGWDNANRWCSPVYIQLWRGWGSFCSVRWIQLQLKIGMFILIYCYPVLSFYLISFCSG